MRNPITKIAIAIHNLPEGLAVGVSFGALASGAPADDAAGWARARALAIGIGLQNFPEGLAVSMPLRQQGLSARRAFVYGQLSGMVEPVGGVVGALLVMSMTRVLPYALAFAAGAMIWVVVDQLLPEVHHACQGAAAHSPGGPGALPRWLPSGHRLSTMGFVCGFVVMMYMDVSLG